MKFITWDIAILAGFSVLLAYSILIRRHKSLATLVSIYIAYVMTSIWGSRVVEFFSGDRVFMKQVWVKASASPWVIQTVLLILITFILSSFLKLSGKRSKYSIPEITAYAICTMALAVLFILTFVPAELRDQAIQGSKIVPYVYRWREWVLVLPVFTMIFFGIYGNDD
jgi:hypothetical protein